MDADELHRRLLDLAEEVPAARTQNPFAVVRRRRNRRRAARISAGAACAAAAVVLIGVATNGIAHSKKQQVLTSPTISTSAPSSTEGITTTTSATSTPAVPPSTYISYQGDPAHETGRLSVINAATGTTVRNLGRAYLPSPTFDLALSSNGELFYVSTGALHIMQMPATGGTAVPVALGDHLTVSPDGKELAYETPAGQVAIHNLNTGATTTIAVPSIDGSPPYLSSLAWLPDSAGLVFLDGNSPGMCTSPLSGSCGTAEPTTRVDALEMIHPGSTAAGLITLPALTSASDTWNSATLIGPGHSAGTVMAVIGSQVCDVGLASGSVSSCAALPAGLSVESESSTGALLLSAPSGTYSWAPGGQPKRVGPPASASLW